MKKPLLAGFFLLAALSAARLELTAGQSRIYAAASPITRVVNASPELAQVTLGADGRLSILPRKIGRATIYYWTDRQEVLFLNIAGRKSPPPANRAALNNGRYELYFKYDPANNTPVNKRMFIHTLEYGTLTDSGARLDLLARYKQNAVSDGEDTGQFEKLSARLAKGGNYAQAGDAVIRYSELSLPYLEMQGLSGRYRLGGLLLDGFAGKRPGNYWGREIVENYILDKDRDVSVGGGRLTWLAADGLDLSYIFGSRTADKDRALGSYSVQGGDLSYRQGAYRMNAELASSTERKNQASAYRGDVNYDADAYGWSIAYRDVAPDFRSLADYENYGGMRGWSLYGRANPLSALSLSGSYENYLQRFTRDIINPDYTVERLRLRLGLNRIALARPALLYHANYRDDYRATGLSAQLYEIELWRRRLWAYTDFSAWKYATPYAEYAVNSALCGFNYRLGWFSWKTERVKEKSRYVFGGESYDTAGWNIIANFGEFELARRIKLTVSLWHQDRKNDLDTLDKNSNSLRLRLGQTIGDLYWYVNGIAARENSLFYEYEDAHSRTGYFYHDELVQSEISGGLVYRF
ncbi:MAG: pilus assembly protein N-terminal domain-containing protein [Candidatus Margulisbacteria bacterium]|jgi:hypothetical protein|nr:pilus assembly protein N-terminal domain-containing protein [Candidatus Margulisiibacteriota bacterium]